MMHPVYLVNKQLMQLSCERLKFTKNRDFVSES